jgi:hypothetical protein
MKPIIRQFSLTFEPGVREAAERYIAAFEDRNPGAKMPLTSLINAAIRQFVEKPISVRNEEAA